jgi:surface protein
MTSVGINNALPEDVVGYILSFLDVPTLVQNKAVCQSWESLCTHIIYQKVSTPQAFQSHSELKTTVNTYMKCNAADAEEIATTYGWPIGRWDVYKVEEFSRFFGEETTFDEDIGSWDVSKAICMTRMFGYAKTFNQDISSWNTANV